MRRAAKVDANQAEIVEALRWKGATVACTHQMGQGFPDVVAGIPGSLFNLLLEIKRSRGKLTNDEGVFHCTWAGQLDIIRTPEQACALYDKYVHLTALLKGETT
jgi:hypothetical protein